MDRRFSENISVITGGIGIVLLLLPLFDIFPDKQQAMVFGGVLCIVSSLIMRVIE